MTILESVKSLSEILAQAERQQHQTRRANEFLATARAILSARSADMTWSAYADLVGKQLPPRVGEILKSAMPPISTTTAADLFAPLVAAFVASLREASAFDRVWPFSVHVPLHSLSLSITSAFISGDVSEGNAKPATQLTLTGNSVAPKKVAALVAASRELLEFSTPAATELFDQALRAATVIACNVRFLTDLLALTTPIASTGDSAQNIYDDLGALLSAIPVGENSRLFLVLHGDDAKALLTKTTSAGTLAFSRANLSNGEILPGVGLVVSNSMPDGRALMIDASGLLQADDGVELDTSRQADLQMESAPTNPATAAVVSIGLWQRNMIALRAERTFAYAPGRPNTLASLSGVSWGA
jgi:Phage capsid family